MKSTCINDFFGALSKTISFLLSQIAQANAYVPASSIRFNLIPTPFSQEPNICFLLQNYRKSAKLGRPKVDEVTIVADEFALNSSVMNLADELKSVLTNLWEPTKLQRFPVVRGAFRPLVISASPQRNIALIK
jgi:hypothetical protein